MTAVPNYTAESPTTKPSVPLDPIPPRQNELHSLRLFCYAKNQSPVPLFFLSAKSHARLSCSLINALTTLRCRYQLFAVIVSFQYVRRNRMGRILTKVLGVRNQKFSSTFFKRWQLIRVVFLVVLRPCKTFGKQLKRPCFGQSPEPLSADSGTLLTKRSFEGLGELFSRRKVPLNCINNAIVPPQK